MYEKPIAIATMMRDSMIWQGRFINQVGRFFKQIDEQIEHYRLINSNREFQIYIVEGNSKDSTREVLEKIVQERDNVHLLTYNSSLSEVQSSANTQRLTELSISGNIVLKPAAENSEYVFWIESDLILTDPFILSKFKKTLDEKASVGIVGGLVWLSKQPTIFYDVFVYRDLNGVRFLNKPPWHSSIQEFDTRFIELSSLGSCAMIRSELVNNGMNFGERNFIELCRQVREAGFKVIADKSCSIFHPANQLLSKRWI